MIDNALETKHDQTLTKFRSSNIRVQLPLISILMSWLIDKALIVRVQRRFFYCAMYLCFCCDDLG